MNQLMKLLVGLAGFIAMATANLHASDIVVILHGLGRTSWSMSRVATALESEGHRVHNISYPSRTLAIETLANDWLPRRLREIGADRSERVHFVTHSLGGIIVRLWVRDQSPANIGRVVMIAPPNSGSIVADKLNGFPPFRWFTGGNGRRLGVGPTSLPLTLGPWPVTAGELGIIAGNRSLNPLFSAWHGEPNDGKVSVASARLEGMRDFLVVPYSHTWLQYRATTLAHIRCFIRSGRFSPESIPSCVVGGGPSLRI